MMNKNLTAILLGMVVFYGGYIIVSFLYFVAVFGLWGSTSSSGIEAPGADLFFYAMTALLFLSQAVVFGFSGWITVKNAVNKQWYFATLPSFIMLVIAVVVNNKDTLFQGTSYSWLGVTLAAPVRFHQDYFIILFILFTITGGLLAARKQTKKTQLKRTKAK